MPHYYAPRIELLPLKAGLPISQDSEVTVLARIFAASAPPPESRRPPLNLSLVIDRSGSMQGQPIEMARRAVQLRALRRRLRLDMLVRHRLGHHVRQELQVVLVRDRVRCFALPTNQPPRSSAVFPSAWKRDPGAG